MPIRRVNGLIGVLLMGNSRQSAVGNEKYLIPRLSPSDPVAYRSLSRRAVFSNLDPQCESIYVEVDA